LAACMQERARENACERTASKREAARVRRSRGTIHRRRSRAGSRPASASVIVTGGARMLDLLEKQTKLTKNQWLIAGAATLGDMLDFFDFLLIGFVVAFIVKDWNLTYGESGAILFASGLAAPFGSLFYGWLADKRGRRVALIAAILNVSIAPARWR